MNHRTHSGTSHTVITNPNAFENTKSATNPTSLAYPTNKSSRQRLNSTSADRSNGNLLRNPINAIIVDFNAFDSIQFDDVITDGAHSSPANDASQSVSKHKNTTQLSAVLKKLSTYFSNSSHKTLNNLNSHNHKLSNHNRLEHSTQLDDHTFSSSQHIIDSSAVFENYNVTSMPVSSSRSECSENISTTDKPHQPTNLQNSSDRISKISLDVNAMCRADDKYAIDGRAASMSTSAITLSSTPTTVKRAKDLKSLNKPGEMFSLPRVSLRQTCVSSASNGSHRKNKMIKSSANKSSLDHQQEQVPSSHYSTEKSGSSGYYSSNVYSTSSVEDHIYSEPVVSGINDNGRHRKFDQKLDQQIGLANLEKSIKTLEKHLNGISKSKKCDESRQQQTLRKNEDIQESTSNANTSVDEQTKRLPTIVEGMDNNVMALVPYRNGDRKNRSDWNADTTDDSLMDLDLDTFLLIDETRDKMKNARFNNNQMRGEGINNPTFQSNNEDDQDSGQEDAADDDDQHEHANDDCDNRISTARNCDENNYKCTKYINSCPDDAYNVDEIHDYKYEPAQLPFTNKVMPFYMKNVEDQLNHQHTKDILEEIRNKLNVLLKSTNDAEHESSTESDGIGSSKSNKTNQSETVSLVRNISALKRDVDSYLLQLNQQNELEIRAFCAGLSKNYKLLTMQHALDNRTRRYKLSVSDLGSEVYSNSNSSSSHSHNKSLVRRRRRLRNHMKRNQGSRNLTRAWKNQAKILQNQHQMELTRYSSSSDNNFQLQRRFSDSVCSSWDDTPQTLTTSSSGRGSDTSTHSVISIGNDVVFPIEVQTLLSTSNHNGSQLLTPASGDASTDNRSFNAGQEVIQSANSHIASNLAMQQPSLIAVDNAKDATNDEKDIMLEWHRNKPSIWQQYYGSKRLKYSNMVKKIKGKFDVNPTMMSYPSTRPETDFTLDVPRAEQLRIKMQQEKKCRCRCRFMMAFFSLLFFLMTVVIFSLMLSRGKRMFGSMVTL